MTRLALFLGITLTVTACDSGSSTISTPPGHQPDSFEPGDLTTWHKHVRPVVAQRCLSCHDEGGAAPFELTNWATIEEHRYGIISAVRDKKMPPWPMATDCREVKESRALSDAEIQVFMDWRNNDFAQGDPADYVAPQVVDLLTQLGPADVFLDRPTPYAPDPSRPDDYRCFAFPQTVEQDMWVTATNVIADKASIVHHVLIYMIPPDAAEALVARDTGDGYVCYGGPGSDSAELISGWVPGMQPQILPEGAAFHVKAGSRFVVQMHYNTLGFEAGAEIPADATGGQLWLMLAEAQPTHQVRIIPFADTAMNIAAGDRDAVEGMSTTWAIPVTIIGTVPHMHLLGKRIALELERTNGDIECITDIPQWDFNWQQMYFYEDSSHVVVDSFDQLHLTCEYDNSQDNQPVVNGEQQTPRTVHWGDGTLDEMCLNYLLMMQPIYSDGKDTVCNGFESCVNDCQPEDVQCPIACMSYAGNGCLSCGVQPLFIDCGTRLCPAPLIGLSACLNSCDGGQLECAMSECKPEYTALWECLDEPMRGGQCDAELSECGVVMTP